MNNQDKFDNLLRDSVNNHKPQPAPALKEAFMSKAVQHTTTKSYKTLYVVALTVLLLLVAGVSSWFLLPLISTEEKPTITTQTQPASLDNSIAQATEETAKTTQALVNENSVIENTLSPINVQPSTQKLHPQTPPQEQFSNTAESEKSLALTGEAESTVVDELVPDYTSKNDTEKGEEEAHKDTENRELTDNSKKSAPERPFGSYKSNSNISLGVFYRPELIYNIIENEKLIHNVGFEVQYRFFGNRYSARTGVGLSVSKGYYEYAAEYKPYLGTYSALDSITLTLAANNFHLIPSYHHSERQVYDADTLTFYQKVYKQHIYLQLPIEFGFDFLKTEAYCLGIRLGPTLSILANDKTVNFVFDPGKDQLIQINQITPERVKTNWHFSGGINYSRKLGHFVVEVEPRAAYYFNSVYEKPGNTARPYSFSLRLAIGFL